jgi:hypothetical protein
MKKLKLFGRKWPCPDRGNIKKFDWKDWEKPWKTSVSIVGISAWIRTKCISNTSLGSYCYPNPLGNSIEQSPPLEADSRLATNKTAKLVWNLKGHYRIHKRLPLTPILSPINPMYTLPLSLRSILILSAYLRPCLPRVKLSLCNYLIIMLLHHS